MKKKNIFIIAFTFVLLLLLVYNTVFNNFSFKTQKESFPEEQSFVKIDEKHMDTGFNEITYLDKTRQVKVIISNSRNGLVKGDTPIFYRSIEVFHKEKAVAYVVFNKNTISVEFKEVYGNFYKDKDGKVTIYATYCRLKNLKCPQNILFAFVADKDLLLKPMDNQTFKKQFTIQKLMLLKTVSNSKVGNTGAD